MERDTPVGVGGRPDAPAVRLDDRAADRQAHAEALHLGAHEVLEDALEIPVLDADPRVPDRDGHASRRERGRLDRDLTRAVLGGRDGLACVDEDVEQDLLELHRVASDGLEPSGEGAANGDAPALGIVM